MTKRKYTLRRSGVWTVRRVSNNRILFKGPHWQCRRKKKFGFTYIEALSPFKISVVKIGRKKMSRPIFKVSADDRNLTNLLIDNPEKGWKMVASGPDKFGWSVVGSKCPLQA